MATAQVKHLFKVNSPCINWSTVFSRCRTQLSHSSLVRSVLGLTDDMWPILGTKPKTQACTTPCNFKPLVKLFKCSKNWTDHVPSTGATIHLPLPCRLVAPALKRVTLCTNLPLFVVPLPLPRLSGPQCFCY